MWRTSLCVRTGDPGTHNQLIYKKKKNQLVGGVPLVARISRKTEVPSALTLRVEVKEPTEDEKHSGSDHPQRFNHINTAPLGARGGGIQNSSSQLTWRNI